MVFFAAGVASVKSKIPIRWKTRLKPDGMSLAYAAGIGQPQESEEPAVAIPLGRPAFAILGAEPRPYHRRGPRLVGPIAEAKAPVDDGREPQDLALGDPVGRIAARRRLSKKLYGFG